MWVRTLRQGYLRCLCKMQVGKILLQGSIKRRVLINRTGKDKVNFLLRKIEFVTDVQQVIHHIKRGLVHIGLCQVNGGLFFQYHPECLLGEMHHQLLIGHKTVVHFYGWCIAVKIIRRWKRFAKRLAYGLRQRIRCCHLPLRYAIVEEILCRCHVYKFKCCIVLFKKL